MLGWTIIFAILCLIGLMLGLGTGASQPGQLSTMAAGYGLSALFGVLFASTFFIRWFTRHVS